MIYYYYKVERLNGVGLKTKRRARGFTSHLSKDSDQVVDYVPHQLEVIFADISSLRDCISTLFESEC